MHTGILLLLLTACRSSPADSTYNFTQTGQASYYANTLHGRPTASGALYHRDSLTAAHRHLPFGTQLLVINPANGHQITVVVNDRGPYHARRIVDLSRSAADWLGILQQGVGKVVIKAQLPPEIADQLHQKIKPSASPIVPANRETANP